MGGRGISILVGYVLFATVAHAQTMILPTGTILRVKLETPVSTKTISFNDRVEATMVQPISLHGKIAMPIGTRISGRITNETDVPWERDALLMLAFDTVMLPDGAKLASAACNTPSCVTSALLFASFIKPRLWGFHELFHEFVSPPPVNVKLNRGRTIWLHLDSAWTLGPASAA